MTTWKPCDRLVPDDFEKYPVWTFDVQRGETDSKADETWVRPVGYRGFDRIDDELFVRASVFDREGSRIPGCVLTARLTAWDPKSRRAKSKPAVTGVILLEPKYAAMRIEKNIVVGEVAPNLRARGPLSYEIDVPLFGKKRLAMSGTIRFVTPAASGRPSTRARARAARSSRRRRAR